MLRGRQALRNLRKGMSERSQKAKSLPHKCLGHPKIFVPMEMTHPFQRIVQLAALLQGLGHAMPSR